MVLAGVVNSVVARAIQRISVFFLLIFVVFTSLSGSAQVVATNPSQAKVQDSSQKKSPPPRRMFGAQPVIPLKLARDGGRPLADDAVAGIKAALALPPQSVTFAPFVGNATVIAASSANAVGLSRELDCSLTAYNLPYSYDVNSPYGNPASQTADYGQLLHSAAGLTTAGNNYNGMCPDPRIGIEANALVYAGTSTGGMRMGALATYDGSANGGAGANVLYTFVTQTNGAFVSSAVPVFPAGSQPYGIAAADLNGDGNPDLVAVGFSFGSSTASTYVTILLGKADGTFTVGQTYSLGAGISDSVVIDDFNGDGKLDIVVPVGGADPATTAGNLTFLPGNGDGTFGTAKTLALTNVAESLVSGDFNGDGKKDLASGRGQIFLGNGDGTFVQQPTPLYASLPTETVGSAQLAVGDFNKDGKLDIAAGNGESVYIYLGNGDGTFTAGNVYAGIGNGGSLAATDLDGDGNLDLYSGIAQNGIFGGDKLVPAQSYALMGRGDGTFVGAPQVNYANFSTLADLNGDGKLDFVGLNGNVSSAGHQETPTFTTYYGNGDGTFKAAGTPLPANFTYQGTTYSVETVDSYAVGDINGDGHEDLIYICSAYNGTAAPLGFVIALGTGNGSFKPPVFTPAPRLITGSNQEFQIALSGIQGIFNQDKKFEILYSYFTSSYNASDNTATYFLGYATQVSNGNGTFAAPGLTVYTNSATNPASINSAIPMPPAPISLTDLNGDKVPDIIFYTPAVYTNQVVTTTSTLQVMLGNSDGTFGTPATISAIANPTDTPIAVGDVNGDGVPDVIAEGTSAVTSASSYFYTLNVALGKGDGTFTEKTTLQLDNPTFSLQLAVGDFNGDGKPDIAEIGTIIADITPLGGSGVFLGNGDGTFQTQPSGFNNGTVLPTLALALATGNGGLAGAFDLDGSGKADILAGSTFFVQTAPISTGPTLNASSTTLKASTNAITAGQSVTLTATAAASSGSTTPTGTVQFMNGTTSIGMGTLNGSGTATLNTTALPVGSDSITASYGGDSNFSPSTSPAVVINVTAAPPPSYALTLSPTSATVKSGASTTTNVSIQPANGFSAAVSFTCSGLPSGATCSFAPATVSPKGNAAATTTLTIATAAATARSTPALQGWPGRPVLAWACTLICLGGMARRRRWRHWTTTVGAMLLAVLLIGLGGCGGSSSSTSSTTPPVTSTVTIMAAAGSLTQTATFSLTVQ